MRSASVDGAAIAAPSALERPRGEEPGGGLRQPGGERGAGEEGDADDEHAAAAEDVAGAGAEQQEAAEGQRVGVLHPRQAGGREAERVVDLGQSGDDDRDVEHDHQVAGEDDREETGGIGDTLRLGHAAAGSFHVGREICGREES